MNKRYLRIAAILWVVLLWAVSALGISAEDGRNAKTHAIAPEWLEFGLGAVPSEGDLPQLNRALLRRQLSAALPAAVDLSADLPPVGRQGSLGSCVGWAVGYYYKSWQERVERGWDVSVPEHQFSPSWIYNQRNTRDCRVDGGMSLYNGLSIIKTKGAATWATFPYQKNDPCVQPPQAAYDEAWQYRSESFANVFQGAGSANIDELKAILAGGMPIAMAVPVYYPSFYTVSDADPLVRRPGATETMLGGHALLIVGYDDAIGGFKFVNSWGTGYGLNGFAYLAYDFVRYEVWEAWVMTDYVEELVEVEVPLQAGWNLISLPVIPASEDPEILFGGIQDALGEVYTWDAVNSRWQRYMPSVPPYVNTLTQVTAAQGLWIKMDEEALLSVRGRPRHGQSIDLVPGWNLVAYPGNVPLPISDALAGIADQVALVHGYDPEQATWNVCRLGTSGGNSLTEMVPGGAYWLQVTAPCTWQLD